MVKNPEKAAFPSVAFKLALWVWEENTLQVISANESAKLSLNKLADGTFHSFTMLIHSLTTDLAKLKKAAIFNEVLLNKMQSFNMKRGQGISCKLEAEFGYSVPQCLSDFKRPYCGCEGSLDLRSCPYGFNGKQCRSSSIIKCCNEVKNNQLDLVNKIYICLSFYVKLIICV